jgi:hypothetical protein
VVLEIDENSNLHDVHVGSSNLTLGATTVIGAANLDSWQVVFVNRQGSTWSGTAWSSASKAALTTAADISGTGSLNYLYLGTSQTAHDISGAVAEVLALDATGKTATDISGAQSKIYQYMKARYPAAGL